MSEGQEIIPAGAPIGRPLSFSWDVANQILDRIADGEGLKGVCRSENMPSPTTVRRWLRATQDPDKAPWADEFRAMYARAREDQADALFDDIPEIADDARNDWMERNDPEGNFVAYQVNGDHIQRSKLRVEARKWLAAKLKPRTYGEKIDVTSGDKPIQQDTSDIAARAAALMALAAERKGGGK